MERSAVLLANFAVLAALLSLGSYYAFQWLVASGWRSTLPWFVSGLAFALILLAVGLFTFELIPTTNFAKPDSAKDSAIGSPLRLHRGTSEEEIDASQLNRSTRSGTATTRSEASGRRQPGLAQEHAVTNPTNRAEDKSGRAQSASLGNIARPIWLADRSFWGATRCVLAIRMDPEDTRTWVLINDCQEDVRILVATCADPLDACRERGSQHWSYVPSGLLLPSKLEWSVSLEEQTVHGLHLRYAACRVHPSEKAPADQDQPGALRHVGVQSCDEEVRALSDEGARSGLQIEELLNEPVPPNPCCNRSG